MAMLTVDPKSADYLILEHAGKYGPGQDHEADTELSDFVAPCAPGDGPGYDRQCAKGSYAKFTFRIKMANAKGGEDMVKVDDWQPMDAGTGSKMLLFVTNLGVTIVDTPEGFKTFDPQQVAPRKCVLEVGEKNPSKAGDRFYTGKVIGVYGV